MLALPLKVSETRLLYYSFRFGGENAENFAESCVAMASFVGFLSGADKYGRWVPESEVTASAYLGGSTVDFSQALFQHPAARAACFFAALLHSRVSFRFKYRHVC